MTEAEWLAGTDPRAMLEFVGEKASDRKKRLFAVACCRRIWSLISDNRSQMAVEVAERFADGLANRKEYKAAIEAALDARDDADAAARKASAEGDERRWGDLNAVFAAMIAVSRGGYHPWDAANAAGHAVEFLTGKTKRAEHVAQVALVRDLFGNPFRPGPVIDPAWLAWGGGTIPNLAQAIHDDRTCDRLPLLADALEDAGCTDAAILDHCRSEGPHVRGCWVVDAILGKQ
jgi:hypothetical protein